MNPNSPEAAYCEDRIKRSTALALASTDISVRLAHEGIAEIYRKRLTALTQAALELASPSATANFFWPGEDLEIGHGNKTSRDAPLVKALMRAT